MKTVALLVVAAALLSSSAGEEREKRKVKPRPDRPINLEELFYQCSQHGWTECALEAQRMLNKSSDVNDRIGECLKEVREQQTTLQVPLKPSLAAGDEGSQSQLVQSYSSSSSSSSDEPCSLSMDEKRMARREYCQRFSLISFYLMYIHMNPRSARSLHWLASAGCIDYYQSDDLLTPQELVSTLTIWYNDMRGLHRCCDLFQLLSEDTIPSWCPIALNKKVITDLWDSMLGWLAAMMAEVRCLESLGRRRKCLRGCVSTEEVKCCHIIQF